MREISTLDELKQIELEIMKKVHAFCEEHDIHYYLAYGTLIGAIRHHGFIPWDDDIDIWMKREDYDKFCSLFPAFAPSLGLELINHTTPHYYARAFSKVINTATVMKEHGFKGDPFGVFIDIWPLDAAPRGIGAKWTLLRSKLYASLLIHQVSTEPVNSPKRLVAKLLAPLFGSAKHKVKRLDKLARKHKITEGDLLMCYSTFAKQFSQESFSSAVLADFEDAQFYIPAGYDAVLRTIYGDYMQLPPEDARVPHHISDIYWID